MTTRQSQIFWFLALYALSVAIFLVLALLTASGIPGGLGTLTLLFRRKP